MFLFKTKGELGCCTSGKQVVDTQGFPPCKVSPGWLSYREEAKVNKQIDVLVDLGKMKPNNFEYACCITMLIKKMGVGVFVEIINHSKCKPVGIHFQCHLSMMWLPSWENPLGLLHWTCNLVFGKFEWHLKIWIRQLWSPRLDCTIRQSCRLVLEMQPTLLLGQCEKFLKSWKTNS
jgi:hypothetical protein